MDEIYRGIMTFRPFAPNDSRFLRRIVKLLHCYQKSSPLPEPSHVGQQILFFLKYLQIYLNSFNWQFRLSGKIETIMCLLLGISENNSNGNTLLQVAQQVLQTRLDRCYECSNR